ncbi:MAG: hypothetical protein ABIR70_22210 [Bryobacteraceae bacterium]
MLKCALALAIFPVALIAQLNTTLSPQATAGFDTYLKAHEPQINNRARYGPLRPGEVRVDPAREDGSIDVKDGTIHDWVAAVLIPGATVEQALGVLQNYPAYKNIYKPEVTDSRVISHNGDQWRVYLRILKTKVLSAELNTEYDVSYKDLGDGRWAMTSRSTRIAELDGGKELPSGTGHGFLWRLNAYWLIEPRPTGVYLECRSLSLSRDIPFGLGFVVGPFVKSLPTESLRATMEATARALGQVVAARSEYPAVAQNEVRH